MNASYHNNVINEYEIISFFYSTRIMHVHIYMRAGMYNIVTWLPPSEVSVAVYMVLTT